MRRIQAFFIAAIGSSFVFVGGIAFAPPAAAQDDADTVIDEIIVTSQKRTEALSEIPMSVSVLSGDFLQRQQADNFQDLVALVPGFSINTSTRGVTRITLRGINTGGVASTVGVYIDDVPFGSSSGLANGAILSGDFDTFDLARIEALRGPQGTLYGASSLGGVLKYVYNQPNTEEFEARVQGSVETVEDGDVGYSVTGAVNVPVNDQFAIRASGFYRFDDGFIDSIGNNPIASLTDPMINIFDGTRVESGLNSLDTFGGRISALFKPTDDFSLNLTVLAQNIESGAPDELEADPVTLEPLNSRPVQSRYHPSFSDIEYRVYSATVDWDFGGASLQSVTSYGDFDREHQEDLAFADFLVGAPLSSFVTFFLMSDPATLPLSVIQKQTTATEKFTQELRLVSPDNDTFEWMVGAYYTEEDSVIDQVLPAVEAPTETVATAFPLLATAMLTSTYEELAVFANATWHITPRFELSFGARQSDDDQKASQVSDGPLAGGLTVFQDTTSSESPFTWSISPRFELTDNSSIYVRIATGYRPGGPNVLPPGLPPDTPSFYDSDELTSYEAGLKTSSSDGRFSLDIAAYFQDWDDIQLFAVVNNFGVNTNGGTAESKGLEFTASVLPTDGLSLSFNGAYTDAELTQDTDPIVGGLNGDPLSYVPEWSFGLNGDYDWAVMGDSTAYVGGNLGYTGERPAAFDERAANGSIIEVDSYVTLNLRAGIIFDQWYFEVYGKNVTDELGVNSLGGQGIYPNAVGLGMIRPRTIGLTVGANF
jgi:outer membrane receptor protein involved in Fe transport